MLKFKKEKARKKEELTRHLLIERPIERKNDQKQAKKKREEAFSSEKSDREV